MSLRRIATGSVLVALLCMAPSQAAQAEPSPTASNGWALISPMLPLNGGMERASANDIKRADSYITAHGVRVKLTGDLTQRSRQLAAARRALLMGSSSTVSPNAADRIDGNCGWSEITFADTTGTRAAYVTAKMVINKPGFAYRTNIHIWDTSAWDFSEWNFPETGNLNGGRSWRDDFTMHVDESGQKYGAQLNRGEINTGPHFYDWCYTGKPKVDNVKVN